MATGLLSSLSLSSYLREATQPSVEHIDTVAQEEEKGQTEHSRQAAPTPPRVNSQMTEHTPEHQSAPRFSPNSLSNSSATMSGILAAHPHFSVFRKSASQRSYDTVKAPGSGDDAAPDVPHAARASFSMRDLLDSAGDIQTPATPPNLSNESRRALPMDDKSVSSETSSFHLSLDSVEMQSLNFGDQSSTSLSPTASPSATSPAETRSSPEVSLAQAQRGSVRLVPDSPPTARTPVSRLRSSAAPSSAKMRSSVGPLQRVQFSPISSCPSPLLSASTLPPPPPPPPPFSDSPVPGQRASVRSAAEVPSLVDIGASPINGDTLSRPSSGILKHPRTPGTGRSVRFTASVVERTPDSEAAGAPSDESPSTTVGSRFSGRTVERVEQGAASHESPSAQIDDPADATAADAGRKGDSSVTVASFLSKLQAAIPSPEVSLVALPPADLPLIFVDPSAPGAAAALTLLEESIPFDSLNSAMSASILAESNSSSVTHLASSSRAERGASDDIPASLQTSADSRVIFAPGASMTGSLLGSTLLPVSSLSFGGQSFADLGSLHLGTLVAPTTTLDGPTELGEADRIPNVESSVLDRSSAPDVSSASTLATLPTPQGRKALTAQPSTATTVPSHLDFEPPTSGSSHGPDVSAVTEAGDQTCGQVVTPRPARSPVPAAELSQLLGAPSPTRTATPELQSPALPASTISPAAPVPAAASSPVRRLPSFDALSSGGSSSTSTSFYRQFMAARARDGLSQSAKEEWSRLERGEKASPKEGARHEAGAEGCDGVEDGASCQPDKEELAGLGDPPEASVYYSPQKGWDDHGEPEEEDFENSEGPPRYFDALANEDDKALLAESSMLEHPEAPATLLSPIVEVTEPESNEDSPRCAAVSSNRNRERNPAPSRWLASASMSTSLSTVPLVNPTSLPPSTPSRRLPHRGSATPQSMSKIPRPRKPITPSQNPFLLQLSQSSSTTIHPQSVTLLQDLFSTQQDQLAASSSQRFLLSSVILNLQNELEHKDAIVCNLKQQVQEARAELREVEQLASAWEGRALRFDASSDVQLPSARKTSAALEETVQLLADELETRVKEDRALRSELEAELRQTRAQLSRIAHENRDNEICLRHAQAAVAQADQEREAMRHEVELGEERWAQVVRERDEVKSRWATDVEERERAIARLRDELYEIREAPGGTRERDDAAERDVIRRIETARIEAQREVQLAKQDLIQRDAALADLREQLRVQRDERDRLASAVQEERQHAELACADLTDTLADKQHQLAEALRNNTALQQDLDAVYVRLEAAELERDRLVEAAQAKDDELAHQVSQCRTALAAMAELEAAVLRNEAGSAAKDKQLAQLHEELASTRREYENALEKRDRVLVETEQAAGNTRKELAALQKENNHLTDLVGKLRRDSADREVKVLKLKKRAAELEEDVFGLNIALDAKQQEAAHWKRQMSSIKLGRASAAAPSAASVMETSTDARTTFVADSTTTSYRRVSSSSRSARSQSTTPFPASKQPRRTSSSLSRGGRATNVTSRAQPVVDPAVSTDDEEHDLTLPPTAYEQTPSRPASKSAAPPRKSARATKTARNLGTPALAENSSMSALDEASKENAVPALSRRRQAVAA